MKRTFSIQAYPKKLDFRDVILSVCIITIQ